MRSSPPAGRGDGRQQDLLRVNRPRVEAARNYNRISRLYDAIAVGSERRVQQEGLRRLCVREGETVLEIGFGTGRCILDLAEAVGDSGKVDGIDISDRMLDAARARIIAAGFGRRVELRCADALRLPYESGSFDGLFMSFTLELFDTPEMEPFLLQCMRVLRPGGRMCVVAMSGEGRQGPMMRLYEWAHVTFPKLIDCRPIYAERILRATGFDIVNASISSLWGLSVEIVEARRMSVADRNR